MTIYKKFSLAPYPISGYFDGEKSISSVAIKEGKNGIQEVVYNGITVKRTKSNKAAVDCYYKTIAGLETTLMHLGYLVKPMC